MNLAQDPGKSILWQPERHLHDDDRIAILTDIQVVWSRYFDFSPEQELFRVGVYDLVSRKLGFAKFGRDFAFHMLKGGVPVAPWGASAVPLGVELHRQSHGSHAEGRFLGNVTLIELDPAVLSLAPMAQKKFAQEGHYPNAPVGMWAALEARAKKENAIERAALSMVGIFKAAHVRAIVGQNINVSPTLRRLVQEGRLVRATKKTYVVPPPAIIERVDWTD